jgi:transposase
MARKTHSAEFRRDAVELYRTTGSATVAKIAADLGIMDTTLSGWIRPQGPRSVGSRDRRRWPRHPTSPPSRRSFGCGSTWWRTLSGR